MNAYDELMERLSKPDCDECGELIPLVFPDIRAMQNEFNLQVENGLLINLSGHYNGFTDTVFEDDFNDLLVLCHDCCVKLFEAFPKATERWNKGWLHPSPDELCCRWGWTEKMFREEQ